MTTISLFALWHKVKFEKWEPINMSDIWVYLLWPKYIYWSTQMLDR